MKAAATLSLLICASAASLPAIQIVITNYSNTNGAPHAVETAAAGFNLATG